MDSQPKSCGLVLGRRPLGAAVLHSSNEPGELSQWLCHDDSAINIVFVIIINLLLLLSRKICLSPNVSECEKLILRLHPDPDQHQTLMNARGSPFTLAYHVWSTSVNAFMSYPARRVTERLE